MASLSLPLLLAIFLLSLSESFATEPKAIFSSNATWVQIGNSLKLKCELANFEPGNAAYDVLFYTKNNFFSYYHISAADSSGHRSTIFNRETSRQPFLGRQALSSTFPVYEITVTPTHASTEVYYCDLAQGSFPVDVFSNRVSITATPPPPSFPPTAHISSNLTSPSPLGHPFTLSCTFNHFTSLPVKYSVHFSSLRDGQLAVYDVTNGKSLLADGLSEKVDISPGPRSAYPVFDLVITEKMNQASTAYWCDLLEEGKPTVRSNTWPLLVTFTGSKSAENQRVGTCAVGATGLELSGQTYSVQFWSDFGPKGVNLLAEYIFKPNLSEEFKSAHLTAWGTIHYGASTSWPNFSILANGTESLQGHWWCVLAVGAQGTPDYREFTSDKATL